MCTSMLQDADTLQTVAAWLTRKEAGLLLAPVCLAGAALVRAADAAEDAEEDWQAEIWLAGWPMWDTELVYARVNSRWADGLQGLAEVLKTLARMIENCVEYDTVNRVFERSKARAGRQASVLGCHRLRVLDATHFPVAAQHACICGICGLHMWHMQDWGRRTCRDESAHPSVRQYCGRSRRTPRTQLVLNLLQVLGLRARRGRGMRFAADDDVRADEVLWIKEYVTESLSAIGWF
jgi:hypothetical protein